MKIFDNFRKFAFKGNVIDLAVGVIIGGAFGKIVTSLVNDIITPLLGIFMRADFKKLVIILKPAEGENPAVTWNYGAFLTNIIDFLIISVSIFLFVSILNKVKEKLEKKPAASEPTKKICPFCMAEIHINAKRCPSCTSQLE